MRIHGVFPRSGNGKDDRADERTDDFVAVLGGKSAQVRFIR
jgi:hypothetical protein